ncbi:MAG: chemotaxis protein CheW [Candidatus Acidiferrales bacterium]
MSATTSNGAGSFVLLTLAARRFALPAETVIELVVPGSLQVFPHTTPLLLGVLVRRGQVVPVADVARVVAGPETQHRKFYLIAARRFGAAREWCAIPVMGDCELFSAPLQSPEAGAPPYVTAVVHFGDEQVPVLDLDAVFAPSQPPVESLLVEAHP